jgi:hypothetical protein
LAAYKVAFLVLSKHGAQNLGGPFEIDLNRIAAPYTSNQLHDIIVTSLASLPAGRLHYDLLSIWKLARVAQLETGIA